MLRETLQKITDRVDLTSAEAQAAMEYILSGNASDIEIAALLVGLRTKGETSSELAAFLSVMRAHMLTVACDDLAVDLCGTGGDHSGSFNLSTAAALVAAAGGVTVAKHGNRAVSSKSGSADFLEALGISTSLDASAASLALHRRKFAFLFAPNFHPAMKAVASVRRQLGLRTLFNLLGPLSNPAQVKLQLVGVYSSTLLESLGNVLLQTGTIHALIVHAGGLDEISAEGETACVELHNGRLRQFTISPETFGVKQVSSTAIRGGDAGENAVRFLKVAQGDEQELAAWIIVNAAPAFYLSGKVTSLKAGAEQAQEVIRSGRLAAFMSELSAHA